MGGKNGSICMNIITTTSVQFDSRILETHVNKTNDCFLLTNKHLGDDMMVSE